MMSRHRFAALTLAVLACAAPATPQGEAARVSDQMPGPAAAKPFTFPQAATRTLANGLRVFVVSNSEQPAVTARLVLTGAGSVNDPAGKPGVAAMTADMLTQGTRTRSAQQIAEAIDFVGGTLSAGAGNDSTSVTVTVVKKDLATGLDLLADVVLRPAFAAEELDRRRQQLLSSLQVQYADADYLATAVFDRVVFRGHPYGLPGTGTPDSVRSLTSADLAAFREARYLPGEALLAFAGDIAPEAAFGAAEKYFGDWRSAGRASGTFPPSPGATPGQRIFLIDKPDAVQTQIRVGRPGITRNHPDYIALLVANRVFGGGFNSRLSTEVRQKKGLTYGAYSGFESNKLGGSFSASTFTRTEATVEATRLVVNLIQQMSTGAVTPEELDFARDYLAGVFPIQSETPGQVAGRVLTVAEFNLPADYNDTYTQKIRAVGPAEVRAMGKYFATRETLDIVVAGNVAAFREALKKEFPDAAWEEISFDQVDLLSPDLRKKKAAAAAASPEASAHAREIIAAAMQAAGGAAAVARIQTVAFTAQGEFQSPQGPVLVDVKFQSALPDKLWMELVLPFGLMQQGYDGKVGWLSSPQGAMDLPATQNSEAQRGIDLVGGWGVFRQAAAGQIEAAFAGEKDFQGKKALGVDWNAASGKVTLFFDRETRLLVGAAYVARTLQGEFDTVQVWSDFRAVDGVQFPFHWLTLRNGAKFSEQKVRELRLNPALDPALFAKPKS